MKYGNLLRRFIGATHYIHVAALYIHVAALYHFTALLPRAIADEREKQNHFESPVSSAACVAAERLLDEGAGRPHLSLAIPPRIDPPMTGNETRNAVDLRGWNYLVRRLLLDGADPLQVQNIYGNAAMPPFDTVYFRLRPRESLQMYAGFNNPAKLAKAREYLARFRSVFNEAEQRFKVSRDVIAAIMLVETHYGESIGTNLVVNRLSRVAAIAEPANLEANYRKLRAENPRVTFEDVTKRARYLEFTFYPELLALLEMAQQNDTDLLSLRGSSAGAFGLPQFLPTTYLRFAIDGNSDGRISLFHDADAILSVANFLAKLGWQEPLSEKEKAAIVWRYNRSHAYVSTVLSIAETLRLYPTAPPPTGRKKTAQTPDAGNKVSGRKKSS